ncbi:MAG: cell wall anchor [Phycisphaerae bacterium]|nr:cell wall anchor [Phycisphaerae bacterium]
MWASGFLNQEPALGVAVSLDVAPKAKLRVIHASPDAPAVDVKLNGTRAITELAFNEATDYAMVDSGTYNVKVVPAGLDDPIVIDADLDLMAKDYTVIASDVLSSITPIVLEDDNALDALARIRFIHASPNAPAVDIALANGGPVLFADVEFGENAGYIEVPGGTYDLEARVAGTDTVALSVPGLKVTGFRNFTVLATGLLGGNPALGVIATLDAQKCATDIIGDGKTGVNDILALLDSYGSSDQFADVDGSGIVDVNDAMQLIMNYGRCD